MQASLESPAQEQSEWIWYDGKLVPHAAATTHVTSHSLHYGVAVFEGVRAYAGRAGTMLFRLREHSQRLLGSARAYGMPLELGLEELCAAQRQVVRANGGEACYVRTIAFYGSEKLGVHPRGCRVHVASVALRWQAYLGANAQKDGIRVKTSSFGRASAFSALPRAKVAAGYASSVLAREEACADGYDEALLLDAQGFVAEGSGENLFVVRRGELWEPEAATALCGITRDSVLALAHDLGYAVTSRRLTRDDVYLADEAFFTGTAAEITPIVELDRRRIGSGKPGEVTRRLMQAFHAASRGHDPRYQAWLTPVD
ncbi:MAG TPA: branched-chain amino acid transaminase [Polyangiaceae bacterium]|nr:branched-chain amino acid transaminase [Polyangiaceae bacterium]